MVGTITKQVVNSSSSFVTKSCGSRIDLFAHNVMVNIFVLPQHLAITCKDLYGLKLNCVCTQPQLG